MEGNISAFTNTSAVTVTIKELRNLPIRVVPCICLHFHFGESEAVSNGATTEYDKDMHPTHVYKYGDESVVLFQIDDSKEIMVEVFDYKIKSPKELLCRGVISLEPFINKKALSVIPLKNSIGEPAGEATFEIEYHPPVDGKVFSDRSTMEGLTIADIVQLRQAFEKYDIDGNGFITKKELATVWKSGGKKFTEKQLTNMFNAVDTGKPDGLIDFGEFIAMATPIPPAQITQYRAFFDRIDKDKNGEITKKELGAYFERERKIKYKEPELKLFIATAECIGRQNLKLKLKGTLNFAEFLLLIIVYNSVMKDYNLSENLSAE